MLFNLMHFFSDASKSSPRSLRADRRTFMLFSPTFQSLLIVLKTEGSERWRRLFSLFGEQQSRSRHSIEEQCHHPEIENGVPSLRRFREGTAAGPIIKRISPNDHPEDLSDRQLHAAITHRHRLKCAATANYRS
jgi:hypothetical protein